MALPFDKNGSAAADLTPGKSFTYEGVGTITLPDIEVDWVGLALSGGGENIATYCFESVPGFKVSDEYKSHYEKGHPNEPPPWPSPTEEQWTPFPDAVRYEERLRHGGYTASGQLAYG